MALPTLPVWYSVTLIFPPSIDNCRTVQTDSIHFTSIPRPSLFPDIRLFPLHPPPPFHRGVATFSPQTRYVALLARPSLHRECLVQYNFSTLSIRRKVPPSTLQVEYVALQASHTSPQAGTKPSVQCNFFSSFYPQKGHNLPPSEWDNCFTSKGIPIHRPVPIYRDSTMFSYLIMAHAILKN